METPASLSNSAAAAMIIQRAFRDAQKRIAADHVDLTAILNSLEEAEEHRINARTGVMTRVEKNLESSGAGFGIGSMIRSLADKSRAKAKEQQREARTGEHLPTLTSGSMDNLVTGLGNGERVAQVDALTILGAATVMLMDEPSMCDITVPPKGKCIVVGDLHGQLDDLLHLFKTFGQPSEKMTWIFNGDLVDRGDHACEIVLLIFALKLKHPKHVFVNRGNHEEPHINIYSGFEEECTAKYDHRVFQMFHAAFVWLPYACLVNGKTLVLHGGLPRDETVSIKDIRDIARGPDVCSEKQNMGNEEWIRDMLWSDPHHDPEFVGYEMSSRGAGVLWGKDATHRFLEKEGLSAMVRSHQCVQNGVEAVHDGRVYTVFSASNYCGTSGNLGAAVVFSHGDEKPTQVYQWDQRKLSSIAGQIITTRQSREQKRIAAVRQAAEYIVENKTALMEYYRRVDSAETGVVSFFEWAKGLASVLQVRLAWQKLVSGLVHADDMDASCDGVRYDRWLQRFTVELKGGCKEWQEEVVGKISAAVLQSGGDLVRAFKEIDTDASGEISNEEFKVAVRTRLPSLAVLSDAQLEAVVKAFDADGSGQVDVHEFADMLKRHIARSIQKSTKGADLDVVGLQWHTKAEPEQDDIECETPKTGLERVLADAVAQLFFTHRRELFHIWHTYFDVEKKGSISADEFVRSVQALDTEGGTGMLSDGSLRRLVEVLDTNGDGRIDFMEFSRNIGSLVERVHGNPVK